MRRLPVHAFRERLLGIMDRKHHWAWPHFSGGRVAKPQLKIHFQQEYAVYVRDFPVLLARVHGKNPPRPVRSVLAENIYEEDTGGLSFGQAHPELFLQMMEGLGYRRRDFEKIVLLPAARRYRTWLDRVSGQSDWLTGAAVLTVFVEGSVSDRKEILHPSAAKTPAEIEDLIVKHPLVQYHGVDPSHMNLIRAHQQVEAGHRQAAYDIVLRYAVERRQQQAIIRHVARAFDYWLEYRNAVARVCGLKPA